MQLIATDICSIKYQGNWLVYILDLIPFNPIKAEKAEYVISYNFNNEPQICDRIPTETEKDWHLEGDVMGGGLVTDYNHRWPKNKNEEVIRRAERKRKAHLERVLQEELMEKEYAKAKSAIDNLIKVFS
jgi:hypothetical protein